MPAEWVARSSPDALKEELQRHELEIAPKLRLRGATAQKALGPYYTTLPSLLRRLQEAKMEGEAKRCKILLEDVRRVHSLASAEKRGEHQPW